MGGNSRKQGNWWLTLGEGLLLALGVYLLAAALIALLAVRAVLPEAGTFPALAVGCVLAAWAGAALCGRRSPWGRFPGAMACAGCFLAVLAAVGILCWEEQSWLGRGGILLLCGAVGGLLAGLAGRRRPRRKGGRRVRSRRRPEKSGRDFVQK